MSLTDSRNDPLWYKDAIIYELHVKAFFDSTGDGIGDFLGLCSKLDHLAELGVTAIWLLPFYPSPLRDDGYDIADYKSVNPAYGSLDDFTTFVAAAHARNLRVITELVINHSSDQHPWFQRARVAPKGSAERDFYIWSDDNHRWAETRIIFTDTEASNWAWDVQAQQYYWHRFFSHQPDLNFDNPQVLAEVIDIMRYWLNLGVDGLRLDAIPYLLERDGTNNENLPETHSVIRRLRQALSESHPEAFFLAEANQWPEDTASYFGDGDECHMCFHFPLMPRMYMAIAQEDRHPIADILRQTPSIPESCQWAIFLRNHDELTLEMVTDEERDYLWNFYAADKRARINLGIRRRLAPLMGNDRRKIKLLNSLLFSMPGTPILFYGDEIGMGDNIYLGDRDGVRTPMQWSPDRNGGFSRVDPARLYLPAISDPVYGYHAVNVEAQQENAASLLNWMRQIIEVRKRHRAFGRGNFTLLYPRNRKIIAFLRQYDGECLLCVANLSRAAQAVELNLSEFRGRVPVELIDRSSFPPISDQPYLLTLAGYGFFWFILAEAADLPAWHEILPEPMPELATMVLRNGWAGFLGSQSADDFVGSVLPTFFVRQRWFAAKDTLIARIVLVDAVAMAMPEGDWVSLLCRVSLRDGSADQLYALPLAVRWTGALPRSDSQTLPFLLAKVRRGPKVGVILDAAGDQGYARALIAAIDRDATESTAGGRLEFRAGASWSEWHRNASEEIEPLAVEQSNTSWVIGNATVLKVYRRLSPGIHPELEIGRFLTDRAGYLNTPPTLGSLEYVGNDGCRIALAVVQGFVRNQGDGWTYTTEFLRRELGEVRLGIGESVLTPQDRFEVYAQLAATLGRRTGEFHQALARVTGDPAFDPEPFGRDDLARLRDSALGWAAKAIVYLEHHLEELEAPLRRMAERLIALNQDARLAITGAAGWCPDLLKTRLHGDFHLGQVLLCKGDFMIVDFEGEPARPLEDRRAKTLPLRDVAGMIRSFDYAAWSAVRHLDRYAPEHEEELLMVARVWRDQAIGAFLDGYREAAAGCPSVPSDPFAFATLIDLLQLEKAYYEICYEAANRPGWLAIPVAGALAIVERLALRRPQSD
ncbi:MAG: maltose alpha-D-glucosyltransferase [Azospirillum sp.]|nr:maltose alpha-D-glucosyltransferase [Azospirillum sp.]